MASVSSFIDNFSSSTLNSQWTDDTGGTYSISNGKLSLPETTSGDSVLVVSKTAYDLTNSEIFCKLVSVASGLEAGLELTSGSGGSTTDGMVAIIMDNGTLDVEYGNHGSIAESRIVTSPTLPLWVRIREASSTIYFEYSSDGVTWLTGTSIPIASFGSGSITSVYPMLFNYAEYATGTAVFSNLNVLPASLPSLSSVSTSADAGVVTAPTVATPANVVCQASVCTSGEVGNIKAIPKAVCQASSSAIVEDVALAQYVVGLSSSSVSSDQISLGEAFVGTTAVSSSSDAGAVTAATYVMCQPSASRSLDGVYVFSYTVAVVHCDGSASISLDLDARLIHYAALASSMCLSLVSLLAKVKTGVTCQVSVCTSADAGALTMRSVMTVLCQTSVSADLDGTLTFFMRHPTTVAGMLSVSASSTIGSARARSRVTGASSGVSTDTIAIKTVPRLLGSSRSVSSSVVATEATSVTRLANSVSVSSVTGKVHACSVMSFHSVSVSSVAAVIRARTVAPLLGSTCIAIDSGKVNANSRVAGVSVSYSTDSAHVRCPVPIVGQSVSVSIPACVVYVPIDVDLVSSISWSSDQIGIVKLYMISQVGDTGSTGSIDPAHQSTVQTVTEANESSDIQPRLLYV